MYTSQAREDYARKKTEFEYFDVEKDASAMKRMLEFSGGDRVVPTIVENGKVRFGYAGGS